MEHRCQHCGMTVEDGRPFCPQCRTPQINVPVATPTAEVVAPLEASPEQYLPETSSTASRPDRQPASSPTTVRRAAITSALKAGGLGIFVGMIPVIGILLTGALAVFFYRRAMRLLVPPAVGSRLGAAAGIVVFASNALFIIPIIVFHQQQQCIDVLTTAAQRFGVNTANPQFQASVHNSFTASGLTINFIVIVALASIGGALASLFGSKPRT